MAINKVIYGGDVLLDLSNDTITANDLLVGKTAHDNSGEIIEGACTFDADTKDATAMQSEILDGRTAYVNGAKVVGNMPNNGEVHEVISDVNGSVNIPIGFHDGSGDVSISTDEKDKIIPTNIKQGVTILGVVGTLSPGADVSVQANKDFTPTKDGGTVTPDEGYDYLAQVTVEPIPYSEFSWGNGTAVRIG